MVVDLPNIIELDNAANNQELLKALDNFINNTKEGHLSKNTQYNAKMLKTIIGLELIDTVLQKDYGHKSETLKTLKHAIRVNSISLDRKGRSEIVEIFKAIAGQEAEKEKRAGSRLSRMLGVGNR